MICIIIKSLSFVKFASTLISPFLIIPVTLILAAASQYAKVAMTDGGKTIILVLSVEKEL